MSLSTPVSAPRRKKKAVLFGVIAAVVVVVAATTAGLWWKEQRDRPSQASKADCALAQKIIDEAQELPADKAAVDEWQKNTATLRRSQMKDGYLGWNIAQYEYWAAYKAKGEGTPPTDKEVTELADKANGHCTDAHVTLVLPPIAS